MPAIFERVKQVTVDRLSVEEARVTMEASFTEDLEADSLDLVELIMALEEEFSKDGVAVEIPDEEAEKLRTVSDVVQFVKAKGIKDT
ncbi:MAG: acyl carrier protein [Dehalococcoidia bacterium]|nr:acyl carrier protein [Dehalococcoidia bacterium]